MRFGEKMNKKQREQMGKERSYKKKIKLLQFFGLIVMVAILTIVVILSLPEGAENVNSISDGAEALRVQAQHSDNGDLHIEKTLAVEDVTFVDYGADNELLLWLDSDGVYRVAFNTCEECYTRDGHYELKGGVLTCSACGNKLGLTSLQHGKWGGCQPIEIPDSGREDTDIEIIILSEAFDYAAKMFDAWSDGDTEMTFENF